MQEEVGHVGEEVPHPHPYPLRHQARCSAMQDPPLVQGVQRPGHNVQDVQDHVRDAEGKAQLVDALPAGNGSAVMAGEAQRLVARKRNAVQDLHGNRHETEKDLENHYVELIGMFESREQRRVDHYLSEMANQQEAVYTLNYTQQTLLGQLQQKDEAVQPLENQLRQLQDQKLNFENVAQHVIRAIREADGPPEKATPGDGFERSGFAKTVRSEG